MTKNRHLIIVPQLAMLIVYGSVSRWSIAAAAEASPLTAQLRRPTAVVPYGDQLLTCNARSGTVSVIDPQTRLVIAEHSVARRISHMVQHPGAADVFCLDDVRHRLLTIQFDTKGISVQAVADVAPFPVRLVTSRKLHRVFVSSRWSRRLTIVDFDDRFERPMGTQEIQLEFPAQELVLINGDSKLIVADAFGGRLAVIDAVKTKLEYVRSLPFHNIRGLALSRNGSALFVSHQTLDSNAWTDREAIHWGILMANSLRELSVDALLDRQRDALQNSWLVPLGQVGHAGGDPGPVLVDEKGRMAVALSGVGEVTVDGPSYRLPFRVGHRPLAMASLNDHLYVANHLDDSVSIIDLRTGTAKGSIPLGPAVELTPADRGELLFFDASLSHDRWMSCHSCHSEGHTISQLADTLGDGGYGAPKRIPSLLGTKVTGPWSWNGTTNTLKDQVRKSVRTTMHGAELSEDQASDLVAFLEGLEPPPSNIRSDMPLARRGHEVFANLDCVRCHQPPTYTTSDTYDVGFIDEKGRREFNPPSLRGVGQRDVFFHDGRVARVEDVIQKTRHQLEDTLSDDDATALIAFLKSL